MKYNIEGTRKDLDSMDTVQKSYDSRKLKEYTKKVI